MKQFDSYLIFGIHLPEKIVNLILKNTNLSFFNLKIKEYNCELVRLNVIMTENFQQENYFLRIISDLSTNSLIRNEDLQIFQDEDKINNFKKLLGQLSQPIVNPYLCSVPIIREL